MSDNMNLIIWLGGLTRDVEIKGEGEDRHAVINLVTTDGYTDAKTGKWVETKDYHTAKTWVPHKVDYLAKHGKKGAGIALQCKHSTRRVGEGEDARYYDNFTVMNHHTLTITRYAKDSE